MNTQEKIEVMQAYLDGKKIESQLAEGAWLFNADPLWDWLNTNYRIKPEPKVLWVNDYEDDVIAYLDEADAKKNGRGDKVAVKYVEAT